MTASPARLRAVQSAENGDAKGNATTFRSEPDNESLTAALSGDPPPTRRGGRCQVAVVLEQLGPLDAARLRERLADLSWTGKYLAAQCQKAGVDLGYWSINRHRGGYCMCGRKAA